MIVVRANETGARGDGRSDDRPALQAAIDRAAAAGGGTVVLPTGMRCRTGTLRLASRVELHLERGSSLVASDRAADYASADRPVLLEARDAEEVVVAGRGTLEGHARDFMARHLGYIWEPSPFRPGLLQFVGCRGVRLEGVTFHDSAFWTVHLVGCERVDVLDVVVDNGLDVPNCDGIVPDRCRDVRIHGCRIRCADDAIVLKTGGEHPGLGPAEDIHVSDCELMCTASAIKLGSGTAGDFRNLSFRDCSVRSSSRGLVIQLRDQGSVENLVFSGFQIETRLFDPHYWGHAEPIQVTAVPRTMAQSGRQAPRLEPRGPARHGERRALRRHRGARRGRDRAVRVPAERAARHRARLGARPHRQAVPVARRLPRPAARRSRGIRRLGRPGPGPGRIPRKIPGILARCVSGLRLRDVAVERGTGPLEYLGEALELEQADGVAIDGFTARGFPTGGGAV